MRGVVFLLEFRICIVELRKKAKLDNGYSCSKFLQACVMHVPMSFIRSWQWVEGDVGLWE